MKLPPQIKSKITTKLFYNKYKYKVVLVTSTASWFRSKNFETTTKRLVTPGPYYIDPPKPEEKHYAEALLELFTKLEDFDLRVETPLLSFYTNNEKDALKVAKVDISRTKYVSYPSTDSGHLLDYNTVLLKRINYGFRITMAACPNDVSSFVQWCENNSNVRLTNRAKKDLLRPRSWGGAHFYVKDDKSLTMVKMFLGSYISKIERVVNS